MPEAAADTTPRKIGSLRLVWGFALRYPGRIAGAVASLVVAAAATLAIPDGLRRVVDKGFVAGGGDITQSFRLLLAIVAVLSLATALRFYFVSWLGERVVADVRAAVYRNLLRLSPGFFEENRPGEIASRLIRAAGLGKDEIHRRKHRSFA